jgi:hypothetical protein
VAEGRDDKSPHTNGAATVFWSGLLQPCSQQHLASRAGTGRSVAGWDGLCSAAGPPQPTQQRAVDASQPASVRTVDLRALGAARALTLAFALRASRCRAAGANAGARRNRGRRRRAIDAPAPSSPAAP